MPDILRPDRPKMPDCYGIPDTDEGLLPWSHVSEAHVERAKLLDWIHPTQRSAPLHARLGRLGQRDFLFWNGPPHEEGTQHQRKPSDCHAPGKW